jgi:hypothetical protein
VPDVSRQSIFLRFKGGVTNADGQTARPLCHLGKSGTHNTVTLSHDPEERRLPLIHYGSLTLAHNPYFFPYSPLCLTSHLILEPSFYNVESDSCLEVNVEVQSCFIVSVYIRTAFWIT